MLHSIVVTNFNNEQVVSHSVLLLKGHIISHGDCSSDELTAQADDGIRTKAAFNGNNFKCVVSLRLGNNNIRLRYCCAHTKMSITFTPRRTERVVAPLYIVCKNHDGKFQSPNELDNSVASACAKINLGAKLIQCLLSEKFFENGLDRRTFQLGNDVDPSVPSCRVFNSALGVSAARNMSAEELWCFFGKEILNSEYSNVNHKYLAFISCTFYRADKYTDRIKSFDDVISITEAHAAMGGGGLAIFGSASLYAWPNRVADVTQHFTDATVIDRRKYMDHSVHRTYGSCFSASIGAVCHELCHTFDLGHTYEGIMGRQFDKIDKEFVFGSHEMLKKPNICVPFTKFTAASVQVERKRNNVTCLKTNQGVFWTRSGLCLLYNHRWFNCWGTPPPSQSTVTFDNNRVRSDCGICVVELRDPDNGLVVKWWQFPGETVTEFALPDLEAMNIRGRVALVAEDLHGNLLKTTV